MQPGAASLGGTRRETAPDVEAEASAGLLGDEEPLSFQGTPRLGASGINLREAADSLQSFPKPNEAGAKSFSAFGALRWNTTQRALVL